MGPLGAGGHCSDGNCLLKLSPTPQKPSRPRKGEGHCRGHPRIQARGREFITVSDAVRFSSWMLAGRARARGTQKAALQVVRNARKMRRRSAQTLFFGKPGGSFFPLLTNPILLSHRCRARVHRIDVHRHMHTDTHRHTHKSTLTAEVSRHHPSRAGAHTPEWCSGLGPVGAEAPRAAQPRCCRPDAQRLHPATLSDSDPPAAAPGGSCPGIRRPPRPEGSIFR